MIRKFKPYPKYKDSGIEWLGQIPLSWEVKKLKHNLRLLTEKADKKTNPVALENIESWTGKFISTETEYEGDGVAFKTGDLLFGKLRPYLAKAYLAEASGEAVGEFHVMHPRSGIDGPFALYQFLNREFISIVDGSTFGAKMPRTSWEFVGNIQVTTPSLDEQKLIAAFLDRETSKIDEAIKATEESIELLQEERKTIISHAVTKGLDPKAKMKDSGIEWLGDVPEHWNVKRLKHCLLEPLKYGANEAAELEDKSLPRFVRITDINSDGTLRDETFKSLPNEVAKDYLLKEGDVLLARSGATVGKTFIYSENWGVACFAGYLIRARLNTDQCLSRWFYSYCQTDFYWNNVVGSQIQATIQNVSAEKYANLVVPLPSTQEQEAIVSYLDEKTSQIDRLITEKKGLIESLKEYRSSLIYEAVTGKIDLRQEVA